MTLAMQISQSQLQLIRTRLLRQLTWEGMANKEDHQSERACVNGFVGFCFQIEVAEICKDRRVKRGQESSSTEGCVPVEQEIQARGKGKQTELLSENISSKSG